MNIESMKLQDEPESTSPLKTTEEAETRSEVKVIYRPLGLDRVAALTVTSRVDSGLTQSWMSAECLGLLTNFPALVELEFHQLESLLQLQLLV